MPQQSEKWGFSVWKARPKGLNSAHQRYSNFQSSDPLYKPLGRPKCSFSEIEMFSLQSKWFTSLSGISSEKCKELCTGQDKLTYSEAPMCLLVTLNCWDQTIACYTMYNSKNIIGVAKCNEAKHIIDALPYIVNALKMPKNVIHPGPEVVQPAPEGVQP